ncbi:hypothetical protein CGGC5_v008077 [Colletotrichum fructicola Nara gc5]|uniref:DUF8212 domain-containing protein n=1 Tax=Colletotrichum fructicola (strain Nara gc5) TaxID=1213859 RepID=A0A7J6J4I5_COLFN|nr:hypothetical protein CFRS1_v013190 [Colletotrichum fructicola]KAF4484446.1 hypothetical protein CGGC5_v008077 [Colletotrichum fructicola Nara gc5]
MPLLYGEGSQAFVRLQEEIAKESNDLSLLAWRRFEWPSNSLGPQSTKRPGLPREPCGILAISPDDFHSSHDVILRRGVKYNPEFTITNKGLKITTEATSTVVPKTLSASYSEE